MTKIIHTADLHLGSRMQTHLDEKTAKMRRSELFDTFERMAEYARDNGVSAIMLSGDIFDTEAPTAPDLSRFFGTVKGFPEIDFLYLSGNHDRDGALGGDVPDNFIVMNGWTVRKYGEITVTGCDLPVDFSAMPELFADGINIVMLHGSVNENGDGDYGIPLSRLRGKNIDYIALGHIHKYSEERLDSRGVLCYSGTPEGRGFDELGVDERGECGFVLLSCEGELLREFIPFAKRRVLLYEYDLSDCDSLTDAVEGAVSTVDAREADMVRLVFTGEASFDTNALCDTARMRLSRYFACSVKNRTRIRIKAGDYETDPSLLGELVRTVTDEKRLSEILGKDTDVTDTEIESALALAISILSGEGEV